MQTFDFDGDDDFNEEDDFYFEGAREDDQPFEEFLLRAYLTHPRECVEFPKPTCCSVRFWSLK